MDISSTINFNASNEDGELLNVSNLEDLKVDEKGMCQIHGCIGWFETTLYQCDFVEAGQGSLNICIECLEDMREELRDFIEGICGYSPERLKKLPMPQIPFIERYGDENHKLSLVVLEGLREEYFKEVLEHDWK